jgi:glycogen debranching enzyme
LLAFMDNSELNKICYTSLRELASENGITASARTEVYGCVFGRDTAITVLKILNVIEQKPDAEMAAICRTALLTLVSLQGTQINIESGEQPGKCIHEYRTDNYERLVNREKPWYVYPDATLKNYDSVDATPLLLTAIHRYYTVTNDRDFLLHCLSAVEAGLQWVMHYGDQDGDHLIEYTLPTDRTHGGLVVQSWTDSADSLRRPDGTFPNYPIAAVEVQAIAWQALKVWAEFYQTHSPAFAQELNQFATEMKTAFNQHFVFNDGTTHYLAQALDGDKNQITTITPNAAACLWPSIGKGSTLECIVNSELIPALVQRTFAPDLFDPRAGLRTMSSLSPTFNPGPDSYHNGSFWPVLNGMVYEGLYRWNYLQEAEELKQATLAALRYFQTPIELLTLNPDGSYNEYISRTQKRGCRVQAWSAATGLEMTSLIFT